VELQVHHGASGLWWHHLRHIICRGPRVQVHGPRYRLYSDEECCKPPIPTPGFVVLLVSLGDVLTLRAAILYRLHVRTGVSGVERPDGAVLGGGVT
jgi:hypothetical protein